LAERKTSVVLLHHEAAQPVQRGEIGLGSVEHEAQHRSIDPCSIKPGT